MKVNARLDALLRMAESYDGNLLPIEQADVNAYARMLARCKVDNPYEDFLFNHASYGRAIRLFEAAMRGENVVPADPWQELRATAWLVQNRSVLKLGYHEQAVLLNAPRFKLVGFRVESMSSIGAKYAACPIWRALSQTHGYFDYLPWPWQNGLKPVVIGGSK